MSARGRLAVPPVPIAVLSARALVPMTVAVLALFAPVAVGAQAEILEQANQLYQQGDYAEAVDAYAAVLEAGFESAGLHYNLGNAYFKTGDLGRAILEWERARTLSPADPDVLANLELARSLTADAIEPLPRFWLLSAVSWWVGLLPRGVLLAVVGAAWLALGAGMVVRILARRDEARAFGSWLAIGGAALVVVFGANVAVRELGIGQPERGVILAEAVPVRSAPAEQEDLTVFEIHEGTRVRIDQRAGTWAEIVLEDGKVGWVPADVMEVI